MSAINTLNMMIGAGILGYLTRSHFSEAIVSAIFSAAIVGCLGGAVTSAILDRAVYRFANWKKSFGTKYKKLLEALVNKNVLNNQFILVGNYNKLETKDQIEIATTILVPILTLQQAIKLQSLLELYGYPSKNLSDLITRLTPLNTIGKI